MTNIHYLKICGVEQNSYEQIKDELIEKLYDLAPRNVFLWTLKYAKIKFNQRIQQDAET
jgi:hypothetical protein